MPSFAPFTFDAIGIVHSPYREKFGIPRQPGLALIDAEIELLPPYAVADAVSGLDGFSHLWLTFVFHAVAERGWKPLVRPPRLGGNERLGVFATRSTHRPNPIGLSVVELIGIDTSAGVRLHIRGADLLDGTPLLDIKPYVPYADGIANARAGFAPAPPARLSVRWSGQIAISAQQRALIEEILAFDPRPAYQEEPGRIYGVRIGDSNVRFTIDLLGVEVVAVENI